MSTTDYWTSDHVRDLAEMVTGFAQREILPNQDAWERDGRLPRELHRKAGTLGLLGASFPHDVGGEGGVVDAVEGGERHDRKGHENLAPEGTRHGRRGERSQEMSGDEKDHARTSRRRSGGPAGGWSGRDFLGRDARNRGHAGRTQAPAASGDLRVDLPR